MLSLLAFLLSIPFVEVLLPVFNQYSDKHLSLFSFDNISLIAVLPFVAVIVGILAGSYPALFISSFNPAAIFRGRLFSGKANTKAGFRKIFVVAQFIIATFFIGCTLILHNQLQYIEHKNLGYDKDNLVVLPIDDEYVKSKYELYKNEILRNAAVTNATATSYLPSERGYEQNVHFKGPAEGAMNCIKWIHVDPDFLETMGLELTGVTYILNESAVKQIGWKNSLGESMDIIGWGPVIGVVKDFHFKSLHNRIEPVALCVYPKVFKYLYVRIKPENTFTAMRFLESRWKEVFPGKDFEYSFLNEDFDKLYKTEIRLANVFNFIAVLSMLVGCLGLFGLAQYAVQRRTKEIGIRKIMGSTIFNVVTLLIKDFIKWVGIAIVLAWPATYYVMNKWLQGFAYQININWQIFFFSGGIVVLIALVTVSFQAIKTATANPVKSLKYE
jgi:putative ABC transport system permease protein